MALKAGRVGVAPDQVNRRGEITGAGLTPEQAAKLNKALVSPVIAPIEKELVGVGTGNEQIMVKIGDGLELSGDTSPYTLKATGGGEGTIVYENAAPGSAMTAGNISIEDVTGYDYLIAEYLSFKAGTPAAVLESARIPVAGLQSSGEIIACLFAANGKDFYNRNLVSAGSNTAISVAAAYVAGSDTLKNDWCILYRIKAY